MGAGTSTLSTRKHSHSQRRRVRQLLRSLSSLLRLLRDAQGQASHSQPNAYPRSGWRADLVGSRVCSSGTTAGSIQLATTAALSDMYEPNQYVMNCGIVDPTAGPIRFSSPISRNLNNGDAIVLLVRHTLGGNMDIRGTCRYAITLQ